MEIKRIGSYQEVDAEGYLIKIASLDNIRGAWLDVVTAVQQAYLTKWGDTLHSIYVRGSLVKGLAVEHVSDVDTFAVLQPGIAKASQDEVWQAATEQTLQTQSPFIMGVELRLVTYENATHRDRIDALIIKIEAACIYGSDLANSLKSYKPTAEIAFQARYFRRQLGVFLVEFPDEPEAEKPEFITWIMRRFLRLGMELVMEREQRFTRDLYLCYESFAKYYPAEQTQMYHALELAINPVIDDATIDFAHAFGSWLADQADLLIS